MIRFNFCASLFHDVQVGIERLICSVIQSDASQDERVQVGLEEAVVKTQFVEGAEKFAGFALLLAEVDSNGKDHGISSSCNHCCPGKVVSHVQIMNHALTVTHFQA